MQLNLFSAMEGNYKIEKPIRLIEFFAGIGAQHKALSVLGVPFESYKICEWAYNSIIAYNSIHIKDKTDYSKDLTKEQLIEYLQGNISTDYNSPCDCSKKPLEWLKNAYNNCIATHNLMNVMKTKGKDLEIVDKDKYEYILTYSFPCQDLSLAGKRKGMSVSQAEGGTRSGLLWEIERILTELSNTLSLPQILIMENVPEVVGSANIKDFQKWEMRLEQLGYRNHIEILNAKDYGIPQNRKRCFMVSVLDEGNYEFGSKIPLQYKLKDFLEKNVDEKYYLSQRMINFFLYNTKKQAERGGGFAFKPVSDTDESAIARTITTRSGNRMDDNFVLYEDECDAKEVILVKNATKKGYLEAEEGDGIDISGRMEYHRGNVQKGLSQTLLTGGVNVGVVVKDEE
jgi:DNA (cytosine-5)-methyltransferase 1